MPYSSVAELPTGVKSSLPKHAQDIYKAAFNSAWDDHPEASREEKEQIAHRIAWSAVKRKYERDGSGRWIKK